MKLGLALSGGGIRGIAHAGALKALEENNIKVDMIGGTSSGGMIACLYAMGYSPYYIYVLVKRYGKEIATISNGPIVSGISTYMRNKQLEMRGLKSGEELERIFNELADRKKIKYIKDIKMPISIPTVDVSEVKEYIFTNNIPNDDKESFRYLSNIAVGKAIRATSSFPAIFCPCEFETHMFLDGGVLDNIPVTEVKRLGAEKVIAINFESEKICKESNLMDITVKTLDIMSRKIEKEQLEKSDYVLTLPTDGTGLLDVEKIDICYELGYKTTIDNLKNIKKLLS